MSSRYQHPRIKRERTSFTSSQLVELENTFRQSPYICKSQRIELAYSLQLSERQIKVWFQNRRMKNKKDNIHKASSPSIDGSPTQSTISVGLPSTQECRMNHGSSYSGHDHYHLFSDSNTSHNYYLIPNESIPNLPQYSPQSVQTVLKGPQSALQPPPYTPNLYYFSVPYYAPNTIIRPQSTLQDTTNNIPMPSYVPNADTPITTSTQVFHPPMSDVYQCPHNDILPPNQSDLSSSYDEDLTYPECYAACINGATYTTL